MTKDLRKNEEKLVGRRPSRKVDKATFLNIIKEQKEIIDKKSKEKEMSDVDFFIPTIREDDNILCREIKNILINEKINIKYLDWENENEKNNFKRGLINNCTMSVSRFERWLNLLNKDYTLEIFNK